MKSIYLKAGKTQDVFNDLKDNFNGTLIVNNNEYDLAIQSGFSRGNIKGISFPGGMIYMEFDMVFFEEARFSLELLSGSPIFFAYCSQGNFQHSFGEQGEKKRFKEHHSGILKRTTSVNSILHFEKLVPIKFSVVGMVTKPIANGENDELIRKLKNTFCNTEGDYLKVEVQNFKVAEKMKELATLPQKGVFGNILKKRIVKSILEMEIAQNTAVFTKMSQMVNVFRTKRFDEINSACDFVMNFAVALPTKYLPQKTGLLINKLQEGFKIVLSRTVHDFQIFMRIERQGI